MNDQNPQRVAIVVGATGALGQVLVPRLMRAGLRVLAVARSAAALDAMRATLPELNTCDADISDDAATDRIAARIDGPVAMAVLSAGLPVAGGVADAPPSLMGEAVNIKVGGMVRLVRAALPRMERGSRLVAIGGHYGFEPTAYSAAAGVTNAALANLMRQMNWAYGPRGITGHLIAPGPMDTERLRRMFERRAGGEGRSADQLLDAMRAESALGALTTLEQVAWATTLQLDPEADGLAGSTLFMDSGMRRGMP
ncbi:MAG: SDR family oxidoreductase [Rubrivivax sp.]|nr:SDR family oxidoreductase [Rubrivivax sp.]